jgi:hypothetical protein
VQPPAIQTLLCTSTAASHLFCCNNVYFILLHSCCHCISHSRVDPVGCQPACQILGNPIVTHTAKQLDQLQQQQQQQQQQREVIQEEIACSCASQLLDPRHFNFCCWAHFQTAEPAAAAAAAELVRSK